MECLGNIALSTYYLNYFCIECKIPLCKYNKKGSKEKKFLRAFKVCTLYKIDKVANWSFVKY